MIERQFVSQRTKEQQIQEYIRQNLAKAGHSHTKLQRTPLGEKITIYTSHPGLIVGRSGENIKRLTFALRKKFGLENPQIEIGDVENPNLDAQLVAEKIALSMERFGTSKFKGIMHKAMDDVIRSGAMGAEIVISGKIPSSRAKSWRIKGGHIKKCGDAAMNYVLKAKVEALLKTGIVGVKVNIMPPGILLADSIKVIPPEEMEEKKEMQKEKDAKKSKEAQEKEEESEAVKEIKKKIEKKEKKPRTEKKEKKEEKKKE